MENSIAQYAQFIPLAIAVFFALNAGSGLVNMYLRYNDRLPIDRNDVRNIALNSAFAFALMVIAYLFNALPLLVALGLLLCMVIIFSVVKINKMIKNLERKQGVNG